MKYKVVAIRDRALDAFGQPFFPPTIGAGIRSFSDEVNRSAEGNPLNKHPEDYDLYLLGEYDDSSGKFSQGESPSQIAIGKDCLIKG